jgi:hypothetical protein
MNLSFKILIIQMCVCSSIIKTSKEFLMKNNENMLEAFTWLSFDKNYDSLDSSLQQMLHNSEFNLEMFTCTN